MLANALIVTVIVVLWAVVCLIIVPWSFRHGWLGRWNFVAAITAKFRRFRRSKRHPYEKDADPLSREERADLRHLERMLNKTPRETPK